MDKQIKYQFVDKDSVLQSRALSITNMQEEACEVLQPSSLFLDGLSLLLQGCRQWILDGTGFTPFGRLIGLFVSAALNSIISSTSPSILLEYFTSAASTFKFFLFKFVCAMRVHIFCRPAFIIIIILLAKFSFLVNQINVELPSRSYGSLLLILFVNSAIHSLCLSSWSFFSFSDLFSCYLIKDIILLLSSISSSHHLFSLHAICCSDLYRLFDFDSRTSTLFYDAF
jgi:hypothetical protein